jgi:hypothetical protein
MTARSDVLAGNLEPPTPGFGGREALFGLIMADISKFDFSGFSALLQQRAADRNILFLGPHLGPRFQTTTSAANNRLLTSRNLPGPLRSALVSRGRSCSPKMRRTGSRQISPSCRTCCLWLQGNAREKCWRDWADYCWSGAVFRITWERGRMSHFLEQ